MAGLILMWSILLHNTYGKKGWEPYRQTAVHFAFPTATVCFFVFPDLFFLPFQFTTAWSYSLFHRPFNYASTKKHFCELVWKQGRCKGAS